MTHPRANTYLHVTWISRYLTGDKSCLWACWFKGNYQGYQKIPSDFDSARWNMEHTDLLNELVAELEEQGCELFIERQNSFRVVSRRSGAVIGGKPDLIAVFPDGRTVVYDVKTGHESASHIVQVQLYMYLLPLSDLKRWKDKDRKLEGAVVYRDGHHVDIPADSIDDASVARVTDFIQKMTSDMPPRRVASLAECGFCELTKTDCPERIDAGVA
ncbi:MAG: PD-(D/E)XK nuclease family protein [Chloroflexi bacterium]|nr:PD-(D/E)XK nuclease family protein [Chloroflexota bacterium]